MDTAGEPRKGAHGQGDFRVNLRQRRQITAFRKQALMAWE